MPAPEEVCQDLSAAGHTLYMPNREIFSKSWLVLDLPAILHDVYGTLFAQSKEIVNEFGLLHCRHLAERFPHMDRAMIKQLLMSLEFCIPVDPSILNVDLSQLTHDYGEEAYGWCFFPLPHLHQIFSVPLKNPPQAKCPLPVLAAEDFQEALHLCSHSPDNSPSSGGPLCGEALQ